MTARLPNVEYMGGDSTPTFNNNYQDDATRDGSRFTGTTFGKLVFTANFLLHSRDYYDQKLLRHEVYQLFGDRELCRFRTDVDLQKIMYGRPTTFEIKFIDDGYDDSLFAIQFEIPSGYKYSVARSNNLNLDEVSFGMNLSIDKLPSFVQSDSEFRIYNPSDVAIDPYYQRHDLILLINFTGSYYQITNNTNGTSYKYNKSSSGNDNIVLNGLSTISNGNPDSLNSDFGFIKLEKGWNDIIVTGATSHTTTFSFPFVYID
ncbi:phage tail family protein [Leuconostoc suionicum]|uniref:phage tail domain-containing protein n=1 Tax=Leuconostoc suionicum TaxID=1511761 RepID=UPI0024AF2075|nr:phage tail domain-containing protein [Leuconostoc suionicum]MDI6666028.1 phage tail family protein [Leuconostoc suionicum]